MTRPNAAHAMPREKDEPPALGAGEMLTGTAIEEAAIRDLVTKFGATYLEFRRAREERNVGVVFSAAARMAALSEDLRAMSAHLAKTVNRSLS